MSPQFKENLKTLYDIAQTTFHWGFVPVVLYLGFRKGAERGMPALSFMSLLWQ